MPYMWYRSWTTTSYTSIAFIAAFEAYIHVYKDIWWPIVGERLECIRETRNLKDRYTVAVMKTTPSATGLSTSIVGHCMPKKISHLSFLFIWWGGLISCIVIWMRRHSSDLHVPQGLEALCKVIYRSTDKNCTWALIGKINTMQT